MKVKSTLYYGDTPIAEQLWELDDKANGMQRSLACLQIEDHLNKILKFEHKIIHKEKVEEEKEDVSENSSDIETSEPPDQPIQDNENRGDDRVEHWSNVDEDRS